MESHVSGGITPLSLGELRQAILAVYVGNPHFTAEEQLQANHQAHEYEGVQELSLWLQAARLEDAERGWQERRQSARAVGQPGVCTDKATQDNEMLCLLNCQALDKSFRKACASVFSTPGMGRTRLALLGNGYLEALENLGSIPEHRGFEAIYCN